MSGPELLRLRLQQGWTQQQLADKLQLFVNTIRNYERERRKIPHVVALAVLCLTNHCRSRNRK